MALVEELDRTITATHDEIGDLEGQLEALKQAIAAKRQVEADALRLYRSATGMAHPLEVSAASTRRDRPREEQVIAVMEAAGRPVSLAELMDAMPDQPERGAISAVVHRAIRRGEVRRLERGIYELIGRFAQASRSHPRNDRSPVVPGDLSASKRRGATCRRGDGAP